MGFNGTEIIVVHRQLVAIGCYDTPAVIIFREVVLYKFLNTMTCSLATIKVLCYLYLPWFINDCNVSVYFFSL